MTPRRRGFQAILSFSVRFFSPILPAHLFSRARKKGFSFFVLWGDPVQNRPQNPAPAGCLFSTRKSRSEDPERGDFGEENCVGKGGADRAKKGKKDAQKVGWSVFLNFGLRTSPVHMQNLDEESLRSRTS